MDTLNRAQRSERMSRIRAKGTTPERVVQGLVAGLGVRFGRNARELPGRPDIVLPDHRAVVFVHGCFWHRHRAKRCPLAREPKSRLEFWGKKFEANVRRDATQQRQLRRAGWSVMVVWECELRGAGKFRYDPLRAQRIQRRLTRFLEAKK